MAELEQIAEILCSQPLIEALREARGLLASARCPDIGCDCEGTCLRSYSNGETYTEQCQWCDERNQVLAKIDLALAKEEGK